MGLWEALINLSSFKVPKKTKFYNLPFNLLPKFETLRVLYDQKQITSGLGEIHHQRESDSLRQTCFFGQFARLLAVESKSSAPPLYSQVVRLLLFICSKSISNSAKLLNNIKNVFVFLIPSLFLV